MRGFLNDNVSVLNVLNKRTKQIKTKKRKNETGDRCRTFKQFTTPKIDVTRKRKKREKSQTFSNVSDGCERPMTALEMTKPK